MHKIFTFVLALMIFLICSCGNKQTPHNRNGNKQTTPANQNSTVIKLESPLNGSNFTTADNVEIAYKTLADTIAIDSTILSINGKPAFTFTGNSYRLPLNNSRMGQQRVLLTAYSVGKPVGTLSFVYTVKPQNPPKAYTYRVINEYPHKTDAYTQGLFYHNGFLYESTGEYGKSSLRKIDLQTGEVLQNINLDAKYFGEGICLFDNRIYQLTWQNHVGFIYNAETFEKISEFNYATEGWGITTDDTYLIFSGGSPNIFFVDPSNMSTVKQIEVYTDSGPVDDLNELEFINGEIWSNIYNDDNIAIINPETGEVTGLIDLSGILKNTDRSRDTDVLNGIAYDNQTGRIFVTGKRWPKIFEIQLVAR